MGMVACVNNQDSEIVKAKESEIKTREGQEILQKKQALEIDKLKNELAQYKAAAKKDEMRAREMLKKVKAEIKARQDLTDEMKAEMALIEQRRLIERKKKNDHK